MQLNEGRSDVVDKPATLTPPLTGLVFTENVFKPLKKKWYFYTKELAVPQQVRDQYNNPAGLVRIPMKVERDALCIVRRENAPPIKNV